jgi:hypothetical protein
MIFVTSSKQGVPYDFIINNFNLRLKYIQIFVLCHAPKSQLSMKFITIENSEPGVVTPAKLLNSGFNP